MLNTIITKIKGIQFGAIPSPYDHRDYPVDRSLIVGAEPIPDQLKFPILEIHRQQPVPRCVGEGLSYLEEWQEAKIFNLPRGQEPRLSSGFIYFNRHKITFDDGTTVGHNHIWQGKGMHTRDALKSLLEDGVCLSSIYANDSQYNTTTRIPQKAFLEAASRKIESYFSCPTWDERKAAMVANGPLVIVVPCYSYWSLGSSTAVRKPTSKDTLISSHLMVLNGWDADGNFQCVNCWGQGWNKDGTIWFQKDYPITECYGIVNTNSPIIAKPPEYKNAITIYYKDERLMPAVGPIVVNDRILLPVRFIFSSLGAEVIEWVQSEQMVYAKKQGIEVRMWLNSTKATIKNTITGITTEYTLDSPMISRNNTTFAPVRFVCEAFGNSVKWDGDYQKVYIN